jgi:hypothetical protein
MFDPLARVGQRDVEVVVGEHGLAVGSTAWFAGPVDPRGGGRFADGVAGCDT